MSKILKKLLATCLIGFGFGVLLVILLPKTAWLFIIGISLILIGLISFFH